MRRRLGPKASRALIAMSSDSKNASSFSPKRAGGNHARPRRPAFRFSTVDYGFDSLVELAARRRLIRVHAANRDFRARIVLALDWRARQSPQQRELADVGERVGDGALKQPLH